jgi:hypothetical protein
MIDLDDYDYDDSPWTREELEALVWATGDAAGWDEMNQYDDLHVEQMPI